MSKATPPSFIEAVDMCSKGPFSNLFVLLQFGCVIPEISLEAEQTFPAVRRHKIKLRRTTAEDRLAQLLKLAMYFLCSKFCLKGRKILSEYKIIYATCKQGLTVRMKRASG